jgi:hypothetical protein
MSALRVLALAFGLLMAAAVAVQADARGLLAAAVAAAAVLLSIQFAGAATVAVVVAAAGLALSEPNPMLATLAGLNAAGYLLLGHAGAREVATRPTIVGVLGMSALGLVATAVPVTLPWAPLLAPIAVLGVFVVAIRPLIGAGRRGSRRTTRVRPDDELDGTRA